MGEKCSKNHIRVIDFSGSFLGTYNEYNGELEIEVANLDRLIGESSDSGRASFDVISRITLANQGRRFVTLDMHKRMKIIVHGADE